MPIALKSEGMQTCPVAICDLCSGEITDAREGIFIWTEYPNGLIDTKLICKSCEPGASSGYPYWMELSTFLELLLSNTKCS